MGFLDDSLIRYDPERDFTPEGRKELYEIFDNMRKGIDENPFLGKEIQEELRKVDREIRARYEAQYKTYHKIMSSFSKN